MIRLISTRLNWLTIDPIVEKKHFQAKVTIARKLREDPRSELQIDFPDHATAHDIVDMMRQEGMTVRVVRL